MKLNPDYLNLHQHSIGSLRDGIIKPVDIVKWSLANNKKYACITDHGSISEWVSLYTECKNNHITPIFGIEGYILFKRDEYLEKKEGKPEHIVLLALNEIGFYNIVKVHNDAWKHFYKKPIMDYAFLFQHSEGVVATTACASGTLNRRLIAKDFATADEFVETMKKNFPDRFFIELMMIDMVEQDEINRNLIQIAKKHNVPTLVNNDAHYLTQKDQKAHQLSLLLQSGQTVQDLENGKGWKFSATDLWMKNEKQLYQDWKNKYGNDPIFTEEVFEKSLWNSNLITSKVEEIYLEHPPRLPKYPNGKKILEQMAIDGFEEKVNAGLIPPDRIEEYSKRMRYELKVVEDLELIDYFLLIKDIYKFCKESDIAVGPGRGCFTPDSKVVMSDRIIKNISDIAKGDIIRNKNKNDEVVNVFQYDIEEELISLTIDGKEFSCTKDHKIEVVKFNKIQWIKAEDIKIGDAVVKIDTYQ